MLSVIVGIILIVSTGFFLKKLLRHRIKERSLALISVYGLQPFVIFWGLTRQPLTFEAFVLPFGYFLFTLVSLCIACVLGLWLLSEKRDRAILMGSTTIANLGNIGVPLSLMLLGEEGAYYATLTVIAGISFTATFGIFLYSLGGASIYDSLKNVLKIPMIWAALIALLFNLFAITLPSVVALFLKVGAYTSFTVQLLLFGIYLCAIRLDAMSERLVWMSVLTKAILLPSLALLAIPHLPFTTLIKLVLFFQACTPIGIGNITLATIYHCKPEQVSVSVFVSAILFFLLLPFYNFLAHHFIGILE